MEDKQDGRQEPINWQMKPKSGTPLYILSMIVTCSACTSLQMLCCQISWYQRDKATVASRHRGPYIPHFIDIRVNHWLSEAFFCVRRGRWLDKLYKRGRSPPYFQRTYVFFCTTTPLLATVPSLCVMISHAHTRHNSPSTNSNNSPEQLPCVFRTSGRPDLQNRISLEKNLLCW